MPTNIDNKVEAVAKLKGSYQSNKKSYNRLTEELLYNYFACSFGSEVRTTMCRKDLLDKLNSRLYPVWNNKTNADIHRTRNILVVGAGASMDSFSGIPGGEMLIKSVDKEYSEKFDSKGLSDIKARFLKDKQEILSITGKDYLTFENYLYILDKSYLTHSQVREIIKEKTDFRYAPVYFNELVAHLLKHSFLDAVINFNFEETLDQAILEEIGSDNYLNVLSDGDCLELKEISANGTLKLPIYIKPHGSNSHKSTLRFTNKHYFDIPNDISILLKCLIGGFEKSEDVEQIIIENRDRLGQNPNTNHNSKRSIINEKRASIKGEGGGCLDSVNLILVGFNNESLEFLEILNNYLPSESKLFYINYKFPSTEEIKNIYINKLAGFFVDNRRKKSNDEISDDDILNSFNNKFEFIRCRESSEKSDVESNFLDCFEKELIIKNKISRDKLNSSIETALPPLGRLFNYIYSDIYTSFKTTYRPQHIHRHKLNCLLFFDNALRKEHKGNIELQRKLKEQLAKDFEPLSQNFPKENNVERHQFFLDKTLVEIAIAILRGHGAVDYFELFNTRVGHYYRLYVRVCKKYGCNIIPLASLLKEFGTKCISDKDSIKSNLIEFDSDKIYLKDIENQTLYSEMLKLNQKSFLPNLSFKHKNFLDILFCEFLTNGENSQRETSQREMFKTKDGNSSVNFPKRKLVVTILCKLLNHSKLSKRFITRLERNFYLEGLQRIKLSIKDTYKYVIMNHIEMILHSANYIVASNFNTINTHYVSNSTFAWQSYDLEMQIHTNLSLDYEILNELKNKKNNVILSISEVGGNIIKYLRSKDNISDNAKTIIQICSFEAVRQLHKKRAITGKQESFEEYYKRLIEDHTKYLCGKDIVSQKLVDKRKAKFVLLLIPFTLHNHHMTLYCSAKGNQLVYNNAVYIWRRGFSSKMNPLIIKKKEHSHIESYVDNDLNALYAIFLKYFNRGIKLPNNLPFAKFKNSTSGKENSFWHTLEESNSSDLLLAVIQKLDSKR